MNKPEIEALLFRMNATYPASARAGEIEHRARVEEWLDSAAADIAVDLAFAAWRDWKDGNDWPPTPRQFVEQAARTRRRLDQADDRALPEAEYEVADPEQAAAMAGAARRHVRELLAGIGKKPPDDDRPTRRRRGGALVHAPKDAS